MHHQYYLRRNESNTNLNNQPGARQEGDPFSTVIYPNEPPEAEQAGDPFSAGNMGDKGDEGEQPSTRDMLNDLAREQRELHMTLQRMATLMTRHLTTMNNGNNQNQGNNNPGGQGNDGNNGNGDGSVNNGVARQQNRAGSASSRPLMPQFPPRHNDQNNNGPTQQEMQNQILNDWRNSGLDF
ncbi:uncharacterized protein LOC131034984 [Cryptomeria japonica]|uniref:uncharacterized protein LOC131034984 n=1 Tax=Cryptomeria japonica TaxID=3369 RepID=UPI0025AC7C89|nr:uncharacterized protein LOC131034984 [Cryptomeria japonica]